MRPWTTTSSAILPGRAEKPAAEISRTIRRKLPRQAGKAAYTLAAATVAEPKIERGAQRAPFNKTGPTSAGKPEYRASEAAFGLYDEEIFLSEFEILRRGGELDSFAAP